MVLPPSVGICICISICICICLGIYISFWKIFLKYLYAVIHVVWSCAKCWYLYLYFYLYLYLFWYLYFFFEEGSDVSLCCDPCGLVLPPSLHGPSLFSWLDGPVRRGLPPLNLSHNKYLSTTLLQYLLYLDGLVRRDIPPLNLSHNKNIYQPLYCCIYCNWMDLI